MDAGQIRIIKTALVSARDELAELQEQETWFVSESLDSLELAIDTLENNENPVH